MLRNSVFNYRYQEFMGTLGDIAFYKFEKSTGCPEPWLPGPVCWVRIAKGNDEVYFHFHFHFHAHACRHFSRCMGNAFGLLPRLNSEASAGEHF
jgi:hypothetical protein